MRSLGFCAVVFAANEAQAGWLHFGRPAETRTEAPGSARAPAGGPSNLNMVEAIRLAASRDLSDKNARKCQGKRGGDLTSCVRALPLKGPKVQLELCFRYVKYALLMASCGRSYIPGSRPEKDAGPGLKGAGFRQVFSGKVRDLKAQAKIINGAPDGAVAVYSDTCSHYGHIEVKDGANRVSDFVRGATQPIRPCGTYVLEGIYVKDPAACRI